MCNDEMKAKKRERRGERGGIIASRVTRTTNVEDCLRSEGK